MQFDRNKLKAVILHSCRRCPPDKLGAVKLHKVLYFLDMIRFAHSGAAVTGATYKKRPYGPTCVPLLPTLREMEGEGMLEIREAEYYGLKKKEYIPLASESPGVLNEAELALLDEVIDFVCEKNTARTISDYSHQLPWEMVEFGEEIPYHTALLLFPSQATPESFELVEQGAEEVETARSSSDPMVFPLLSDFRKRILEKTGRVGI